MPTIEEELQSLITQVDNILSKPFMVYDVEFGDFKFRFEQPITREEIVEFKEKKKEFLYLIFSDALRGIIFDIVHEKESHPWTIVEQFLISDLKETEVQSEQTAEELKTLKEQAAKDAQAGNNQIAIDLDSVYVNMQRQDWTSEDQEKLIMEQNNDKND